MKNMILTSLKLFSRNKGFMFSVIIIPSILFLLMSVLLPYTEKHSVAVINNTENKAIEESVTSMEGIRLVDAEEKKVSELLARGDVEVAVIINEDAASERYNVQVISIGDCEIKKAIELAVNNPSSSDASGNTKVNPSSRGKNNIMNTLPFLLYKFIESGLILGTMIITDRKTRIKDRILLSGVKPIVYISGMTSVYFVLSCFGSALYCVVAALLRFDFGMRHPIDYFIMLCLVNLFSAGLYVFFASIVNSNESLDGTGYIVLIFAFFSGMLFPFDYMPKAFKMIGNFAPQRWIVQGIENIRREGAISAALPQMILLIATSLLLLTIGVYRNCRKTYKN